MMCLTDREVSIGAVLCGYLHMGVAVAIIGKTNKGNREKLC